MLDRCTLNLTQYNEKKYLFSLFAIFILIKSIFSLFFTPVQWSDEYVWYSVAHDIFSSSYHELLQPVQLYPIGYPSVLSVANFFSGEKEIVFHLMLVINSVLTSSIIFPSYYLLKKYTTQIQAFLGSILITVLPSVMLYNFILMTENLFMPLVLFSIWILHEAFERKSVLWDFFAGVSILLLYLTRDTTGIVFIAAFVLAQVFFGLVTEHTTRFRAYRDKLLLLIAVVVPLCIYVAYRVFYSGLRTYFNHTQFLNGFLGIFSNISSIADFFILTLCHIDYLIISSYILIFIVAVFFMFECLVKHDILGFYREISQNFSEELTALRAVIFYCVIFCIGLLVVNVIFIRSDVQLTSVYGIIQGRYIYPVIPVLFLFGIIGLSLLFRQPDAEKRYTWKLIAAGFPLLCLSIPVLPHISPTIVNNYSLVYISTLVSSLHPVLILILLAVMFLAIPWILLKKTNIIDNSSKLLIYFIILTVIISIPTYDLQLQKVQSEKNVYQNAKWLEEHGTPETITLMSYDDFRSYDGWIELFRNKFWSPGNVDFVYLSNYTYDDISHANYFITKRWLPYKCVSIAYCPDGYKIYDIHANISPYEWGTPILFGKNGSSMQYQVSGWSFPEDGFTWTSGNASRLVIPIDRVPDTVFFTIRGRAFTGPGLSGQKAFLSINDNEISEPILMNGAISRTIIKMPGKYLKTGENTVILRFPDATSPKNLGMSSDDRLLGLGVFEITLSSEQPNVLQGVTG